MRATNQRFQRLRSLGARVWPPILLLCGVVTVYWKLALTRQYTFLQHPDGANQIMPWLEAQVYAIRHGSILLWDPYEWFGQSLIGQVQPAVASPFTFLLAIAPLHNGQIQTLYLNIWFVLIHCAAGLFAYWFLLDLGCARMPAVVGGIFYATAGYCGNTGWPQQLAPGIWAPLVFLFLLRSLRGRAPLKNAAWAGVMLGLSWLCGHHEPSFLLTLAALGVSAAWLVANGRRSRAFLRIGIVFAAAGLVSAVQVLPAIEYGKLAKRWTATGALKWNDRVGIQEHEDSALTPADLPSILVPGGSGLRTDPFVGIVGLSLAAMALAGAFHRREVRLFLVLGVCALLYSLAANNALYGPFYVFVPLVEKSRSPMVALSVFHFAVAALAGMGAHWLYSKPEWPRVGKIIRAVAGFGAAVFGLACLHGVTPAISLTADSRIQMVGLLALLLAGLYHAWSRGYLRREWALALVGLLLVVEQGNEVTWALANKNDAKRAVLLTALVDSQDVADFLNGRPSPKRVAVTDDAGLQFSFGDWYRIDSTKSATASMPAQTAEMGWWQDRMVRMYGIDYMVSKTATRAGQQELFTGKTGVKVFLNPDALPRAWTVHEIIGAPDERKATEIVRDGDFDLGAAALMVGAKPGLDRCEAADKVSAIEEAPSSVRIGVEMACKGLLIVGDNWYPGWRAEVDGESAPIWKVNTVIRGVVVGQGRHTVVMNYRPGSVYFGFVCTIMGLAGAVLLQRRREENDADCTV